MRALGALGASLSGRAPGQLVIQLTDRCNARCPQCGMSADNRYGRSSLPPDDVKRAIDHAAAAGIRMLSLTGGEPFLMMDDLIALVDHATGAGMDYVRTGTNGYMLGRPGSRSWDGRVGLMVEKLAPTRLRNLWISIDSSDPDEHDRIRGLADCMRGIERALPRFHDAGIYPSANIGLNRLTGGRPLASLDSLPGNASTRARLFGLEAERAIRSAFERVIGMGFTLANVCYPMCPDGLSPVYGAASRDDLVSFSRIEKGLLMQALARVIPAVRSRIRVFTPLSSLSTLVDQLLRGIEPEHPCRGGADYFFIDARDGDTYPCGYRGTERMGRFWDLDLSRPPMGAGCTACTWECFRDASELHGAISGALMSPLQTATRLLSSDPRARVLAADVAYFACADMFHGRRPPDPSRLGWFADSLRSGPLTSLDRTTLVAVG